MEINLRRMDEYNSYNLSILRALEQSGHLSTEDMERGIQAMNTLHEIYESVAGGTTVDGRLKIIGIE